MQPSADAVGRLPGPVQEALGSVRQTADGVVGSAWGELPWEQQQAILAMVQAELERMDGVLAGQLANLTGWPIHSVVDVVPALYDQLAAVLAPVQDEAGPMTEGLLHAIGQVLESGIPVPVVEPGPPPSTQVAIVDTCDPFGEDALLDLRCLVIATVVFTLNQAMVGHRTFGLDRDGDGMDGAYQEQWGARVDDALRLLRDWDDDGLDNLGEFRWEHVPACVAPVILDCMDHERDARTGEGGDHWLDGAEVRYWNNPANDPLLGFNVTIDNPRGQVPPEPVPAVEGGDETRGSGGGMGGGVGDSGGGGGGGGGGQSDCGGDPSEPPALPDPSDLPAIDPNNPPNVTQTLGLLLQDPDRLLDSDGDGNANVNDTDSDNDGLLDGVEFHLLGTYPEHADSDCAATATACTASTRTWLYDPDRQGSPGTGDGLGDQAELAFWATLGGAAWQTDHDADGIQNNLLDPDSEGDGLLDGHEILLGGGQVRPEADAAADADAFDRDRDGTPEQAWPNLSEYRYGREASHNEAAQGPWLLGTNPKDPDTDKGSDGYEVFYASDPRVPADANLDQDQDGLNWTHEVRQGTGPGDPDTDRDGLCDGGRAPACHFPGLPSVGNQPGESDYGSVPYATDSDGDGLPDPAEAQLLDPTASGQAQDVNGDC